MYIRIHIRYAKSSLAVVVFFIVKSKSKRSRPGRFCGGNMKENIRAIFIYIAANFRIPNRIEQRENVRIFVISNTNRIFVPSSEGIWYFV